MSTHGVFIFKDGDYIWGFHITSDGYEIKTFYDSVKLLIDPNQIFEQALLFFAETEYSDLPNLNFYRVKYKASEDYSHQTHYTLYFDGIRFHNDWE